MDAKPIFFSQTVTEALADIQENHADYDSYLDEINGFLLDADGDANTRLGLLSFVRTLRGLVRQLADNDDTAK